MSIVARDRTENVFEPAPEGQHLGVCCDVVDMGLIRTQWGEKHKIKMVWQLAATTSKGVRYLVQKIYTLSLAPKANLRKDLERWRDKPYTEDQAKAGIDTEKMIGITALLTIKHHEKGGSVYANVDVVMPPPEKNFNLLEVTDYIREKDRKEEPPSHPEPSQPYQRDEDYQPRKYKNPAQQKAIEKGSLEERTERNRRAMSMFAPLDQQKKMAEEQKNHKGGEFGSKEDDKLPF